MIAILIANNSNEKFLKLNVYNLILLQLQISNENIVIDEDGLEGVLRKLVFFLTPTF
jgi:hypothetical protein